MDLTTGEGKQRALNFLLPYIQKIPNGIMRSEWATRIAQQLRIDEPLLRSALSKAAKERRSELKTQPELVPHSLRQAERRLICGLAQEGSTRSDLARRLREDSELYRGLEAEKIFTALIIDALSGKPLQVTEIVPLLEERDRRLLFELVLAASEPLTWREAESCLAVLRIRRLKIQRDDVQRQFQEECTTRGIHSPEALQLQAVIQDLLAQLQAEESAHEAETKKKAEDEPDPVLEEIRKKIEK